MNSCIAHPGRQRDLTRYLFVIGFVRQTKLEVETLCTMLKCHVLTQYSTLLYMAIFLASSFCSQLPHKRIMKEQNSFCGGGACGWKEEAREIPFDDRHHAIHPTIGMFFCLRCVETPQQASFSHHDMNACM